MQGPPRARTWRIIFCSLLVFDALLATFGAAHGRRFDGFNVIATRNEPFGSASAERALAAARQLGANTVAIIPFLWQADTSSTAISLGADMSGDSLRLGIRQARAQGLAVVIKPQVWVPESWAGAVDPGSDEAWRAWFSRYRTEILRIGQIAAEEGADAFAIGTELAKATQRPEWTGLIAAVRRVFPGTLFYVAHNVEEAEAVPFWSQLDAIGVSLYPVLGADQNHAGRLAIMRAVADHLDLLSNRIGRPVVVAEIGLRSGKGAAAKPWESAEERVTSADPELQAEVIADWLDVLNRPAVHGVMIWRWFTDPEAGGLEDTDFTVQGKPAAAVLSCAWLSNCPR